VIIIGGREVIVDAEDIPFIAQCAWHLSSSRGVVYAATSVKHIDGRRTFEYMHRMLTEPGDGMVVDHANCNTLDNRKENLRVCSNSDNLRNRGKPRNNTSGYKGVYWNGAANKWQAYISINGRSVYLGVRSTPEEAYKLRVAAEKERSGEFYHG
jgi:hypothetical protein